MSEPLKRFRLILRDLSDQAHAGWDQAEQAGYCMAYDRILDEIDRLAEQVAEDGDA